MDDVVEKVIVVGVVGFGLYLLWVAYSFNTPTGTPGSAFQPLT